MVRKRLDTPKYIVKDKSRPLRLIKISNAQADMLFLCLDLWTERNMFTSGSSFSSPKEKGLRCEEGLLEIRAWSVSCARTTVILTLCHQNYDRRQRGGGVTWMGSNGYKHIIFETEESNLVEYCMTEKRKVKAKLDRLSFTSCAYESCHVSKSL